MDVALGVIKSVLDIFTVPKSDDIRPVYNGASSLNDAIWAPWFGLPTVLHRSEVYNLELSFEMQMWVKFYTTLCQKNIYKHIWE